MLFCKNFYAFFLKFHIHCHIHCHIFQLIDMSLILPLSWTAHFTRYYVSTSNWKIFANHYLYTSPGPFFHCTNNLGGRRYVHEKLQSKFEELMSSELIFDSSLWYSTSSLYWHWGLPQSRCSTLDLWASLWKLMSFS